MERLHGKGSIKVKLEATRVKLWYYESKGVQREDSAGSVRGKEGSKTKRKVRGMLEFIHGKWCFIKK